MLLSPAATIYLNQASPPKLLAQSAACPLPGLRIILGLPLNRWDCETAQPSPYAL